MAAHRARRGRAAELLVAVGERLASPSSAISIAKLDQIIALLTKTGARA